MIYPVDSVIQPLNNPGQVNIPFERHQSSKTGRVRNSGSIRAEIVSAVGELRIWRSQGGTYPWSINRQMQVTQPWQKTAGSKRNAYTPKGARNCKINGSGWKSSKKIENDSKGDSVHALEDKRADYGTRKRGNCCRCGLEGHFARETRNARPDLLLAKNVRRLDTSQSFVGPKAKIKPRKEDDDFAFTVQLSARDIPWMNQSRSQSFVPLDQRSENESSGSIHFRHAP